MIKIYKTTKDDIDDLMRVRLETLRAVNEMNDDAQFSETLVNCARDYFLNGDQTTVFAEDSEASEKSGNNASGKYKGKIIGCASMSYITIMPTYEHPTGKRAFLMNVYVNKNYRRQGIAQKMITILIEEAKERGCSEISLDATQAGRPVYKTLGFCDNDEAMILNLGQK